KGRFDGPFSAKPGQSGTVSTRNPQSTGTSEPNRANANRAITVPKPCQNRAKLARPLSLQEDHIDQEDQVERESRRASASPTAPDPSLFPSSQPAAGGRHASTLGTTIAPDWQPEGQDRAFAEQLGLDPDEVAAAFRDYWLGASGSRARKRD